MYFLSLEKMAYRAGGGDEIKSYILPLRVKRNCLSSGKYGFTLTSSPVALEEDEITNQVKY